MRNDTKIESALSSAVRSIDLHNELPKCLDCLADGLKVTEEVITETDQNGDVRPAFRFLRSFPPMSQTSAGHILLLHDQTNDANVWRKTLQILSASGFCCVAPHVTNFVFDEEKNVNFLLKLASHIGAREVVLVASSMSGIYLIPFLSRCTTKMGVHFRIKALIAIGISDTHRLKVEELADNPMPCLIIKGTSDTSIGLNAANKLKHLPNSRLFEITGGKHLCHLSHPSQFHKALFNFLTKLNITPQEMNQQWEEQTANEALSS